MNPKNCNPAKLAASVARKHASVHGNFDHYAGIVTLHGMARLGSELGMPGHLDAALKALRPYINGERRWRGNFPNYFCGGNASAWMLRRGHLPDAAVIVRHYAEEILNDARRSAEGILSMPGGSAERVWIDAAFAVTPFLVFSGLALENEDYVTEGFEQAAKMVGLLRNSQTGLLHQSRGFAGPGKLSEDHWSRGNGWGAYALAELASELPERHSLKDESVRMYRNLIRSALEYQDKQGLWRQEMTELKGHGAYAETSGSGLILYAIGRGLQAGIGEESWRGPLLAGLRGLLEYITADLDIFHTCRGCLCPRDGSKLAYMAVPPVKNDVHAFGPYVLAFGQAAQLGFISTGDLS